MVNVTFVCLGNICRSPMAEGIFQEMVTEAGLGDEITVDSAGTSSYHVGEAAHPGTRQILKKNGVDYVGQARQIRSNELSGIDYIIAMDRDNLRDLQYIAHDSEVVKRMSLLLSYAESDVVDVPDPYYTGNFERVYGLVSDGCTGLLRHIRERHQL